jgi:hypothetical protein
MWQRTFLQSNNYVIHTLMFDYIIIRLQKRTLPHTEKLKKMYYY